MATDAPLVKTEEGENLSMAETPGSDDDMYEDAGDLEFYDKNDSYLDNLWLARVPKYVWQAWWNMSENLGMDDEIEIGKMRSWEEMVGENDTKVHARMRLNVGLPEHQLLPKVYVLEEMDREVKNHYVFSERDTEKYREQNKIRKEMQDQRIPMHARQPRNDRVEKPKKFDRRSKYQPFYRKAIPKKTKIYGRIGRDFRCEPQDTAEETRLLSQHLQEADAKAGIKIISRNKASAITNPGVAGSTNWGSNFIKSAPPAVKPKKGETVKAVRLPKDQVLDLIFKLFKKFQYYPMKALRQETNQPDAWLRQIVEEVCVLEKTGPFANTYRLNDAYRDMGGADAKVAAAVAADEDEDEDEEMEDVLPA